MGSVGFDVLPQSRQGAKDRKDFVWFFCYRKEKKTKNAAFPEIITRDNIQPFNSSTLQPS